MRFLTLLQSGPVIVHGAISHDLPPPNNSGHYVLVTAIAVDGFHLVANDPLLGLQIRFQYKNGIVSKISDVYDPASAMWIPFTYENREIIAEISHIEPERFESNFNELCGCDQRLGGFPFVPQTFEMVTIH
jgi:hypothetical protein